MFKSWYNKAFKSDSQRLAVSLRSSIAKRRSHLNAALCFILTRSKNENLSIISSNDCFIHMQI
ncbi:hypothetical protein CGI29_23160 [Vibrio parahaemolyticus]|nr:hypothetical protein CGI41_23115 [Vibrio parahaemolyticus]TOJ76027.1 hypothetical protein CGI31_23175 [Vibrio parahaemolyticus]TOJ90602.1 hypothetical protein CGI29_23160 [Vibrio parahaemolyticus]